jgi:hypothetical protein
MRRGPLVYIISRNTLLLKAELSRNSRWKLLSGSELEVERAGFLF